MRVVVAEKPSVARDLARVLGANTRKDGWIEGAGLRITWCVGHMVGLREPGFYDPRFKAWSLETLPIVPEAFALGPNRSAPAQLAVLRKLLRDPAVESVVNACDAGREGELIFRYIYQFVGCERPVQRLWISSLTDEAIRQGWARLRPGSDFDPLADAARCRSEADWLVGLNATRAMTCLVRKAGGDSLYSVGRVQTPTLAMIVARDAAIEAFVPETFWQVKATLRALQIEGEASRWEATWTRQPGAEAERKTEDAEAEAPRAERLATEELAQAVARAAEGQQGRVSVAQRKRTRERPPLLYDLTALQRRANQRYGLSAQRTLELAQELYEKKLLTYPRTDARYLTPDQVPGLPDVLRGLLPIAAYQPFAQALLSQPIRPGKRVVNAAEVGDHHAILPTGKTPSSGLSADAKRIYDLVARRLMAALSDDALFDVTTLVVEVPPGQPLPEELPSPLIFQARGRVCRQEGWRAVDPPGRSREIELPPVEVGDPACAERAQVLEGVTRPPRPHTDASLLRAMETAGRALDDEELARNLRSRGLGTPATRASTLQTLLDRKFVIRAQRALRATAKGRALIEALPVEELKSAELTGMWEGRLGDIAEGREQRQAFMSDVVRYLEGVVQQMVAAPLPEVEAAAPPEGAVLGSCPICEAPVRERARVFACDTDRECVFVVYKQMSKRKISPRMVRQLLAEGRSPVVKGFKSKKGKDFSAGLCWDEEARRVGFWFADGPSDSKAPPRQATATSPAPAPDSADPSGGPCPTCGQGTIIRGRAAWGCDRWREGCGWRRPFPS